MTTPEQQPALHWRRTSPAFAQASARAIMEQGLEIGHAMRHGLEGVIASHLKEQTPLVLQGDHLYPALAAQTSYGSVTNDGRVRAVFLHEPDEQQIAANPLPHHPRADSAFRALPGMGRRAARIISVADGPGTCPDQHM